MPNTCSSLLNELSKSVDKLNDELVDQMTRPEMRYQYICIKPNITYDYYFKCLKRKWEEQINTFVNTSGGCGDVIANTIGLLAMIQPNYSKEKFKTLLQGGPFSQNAPFSQNDVIELVSSLLMKPPRQVTFELTEDAAETINRLLRILAENCTCQMVDIFKTIIDKYSVKYHTKFVGKTKEEVVEILKTDYQRFLDFFQTKNIRGVQHDLVGEISSRLTSLYQFSVESELERLIPDELASLKVFFITVIATYFDKLHPIIWVQMLKQMYHHIFTELPYTYEEIFRFVSKHILLNCGPFILKILQMIRPVLSPELAVKYNLTKLTYPMLTVDQVDLILSRVVSDWEMYQIIVHKSASVGHVCLVHRVDRPEDIFVIKIIKPLAIAQSCWEYKTLYQVFAEGTCEREFVKKMLESNGRELNILNEMENIKQGHQYYTTDYRDVYNADVDAVLTTIDVKEGVLRQNSWFTLAMTLAPGVPLSELVENNLLEQDTKYRAKLHRCLDLWVNRFFYILITKGYYHGDPHAGNIFFSYEDSQLTLIDFGSVSQIDLFADDPDIYTLIDILVMATFYNYEEVLDSMTQMINSRCPEIQMDTQSKEYLDFHEVLREYHLDNVGFDEMEIAKAKQYEVDIFSEKRINDEKSPSLPEVPKKVIELGYKTVYSYLEYQPKEKEIIIENKDVLPSFTLVSGETKKVTFAQVLEMIIKFYATSGVNIVIKFPDFYELQKAYALLLGVLHKVHYNSYRMNIALRKAILNWSNIKELIHVKQMIHLFDIYTTESKKYNEILKSLQRPEEPTHLIQVSREDEVCPSRKQLGAGVGYYNKYIKYKTKYLQLKNSQESKLT